MTIRGLSQQIQNLLMDSFSLQLCLYNKLNKLLKRISGCQVSENRETSQPCHLFDSPRSELGCLNWELSCLTSRTFFNVFQNCVQKYLLDFSNCFLVLALSISLYKMIWQKIEEDV